MQRSYIDYAMSVIVGRALPDVRDGLKPVHVRILWAMYDGGYRPDLENFDATDEELLAALIERVKGPDFPTRALIVGRRGIEEAYRTGRGSITMRAVVTVDEDRRGRTCLIVTELPYQVNPDNLAAKIAELVRDGRINGIAELRDETSGRTGQRLASVL